MSRLSRWKIVYSNGDVEVVDQLVNLKLSVDGSILRVESPSDYVHEPLRLINMAHVRSWERVER
jgi:hypothetical protein